MTAQEAYKIAVEDHSTEFNEIIDAIMISCMDGEFVTEFYEDEFSNTEEHMNKLRELGYNVNRIEENSEVIYEVSWEHAK